MMFFGQGLLIESSASGNHNATRSILIKDCFGLPLQALNWGGGLVNNSYHLYWELIFE